MFYLTFHCLIKVTDCHLVIPTGVSRTYRFGAIVVNPETAFPNSCTNQPSGSLLSFNPGIITTQEEVARVKNYMNCESLHNNVYLVLRNSSTNFKRAKFLH